MLLHPIQYDEGIIWVDTKAIPKENQKLFCLQDLLWGKKGQWCTFLTTSEHKCRVLGNNGQEYLAQCSIFYSLEKRSVCIPVAQTGLNLPDIPYIDTDISGSNQYTEEDIRYTLKRFEEQINRSNRLVHEVYPDADWAISQLKQRRPISVEVDVYNGNTGEFCEYWKEGKAFIKVTKFNYETDSSSK